MTGIKCSELFTAYKTFKVFLALQFFWKQVATISFTPYFILYLLSMPAVDFLLGRLCWCPNWNILALSSYCCVGCLFLKQNQTKNSHVFK